MASRSFLVSFTQAFEAILGPRPGGTFGALLQAPMAHVITMRTRTRDIFLAASMRPPFRGTSAAQKAQPSLDTNGEGNSSTGRARRQLLGRGGWLQAGRNVRGVFPFRSPAVVADDLERMEDVLLAGALSDVVDHVKPIGPRDAVLGDDPDMKQAAGKTPSDDVPRLIGRVERELLASPLEILHEVGNPAVIDIAVRPLQSPAPGIDAEILHHVGMDLGLEINSHPAEGPHHDVGADAA